MANRTFSASGEYRSLDGFKEGNPVTAERYFGIVGDYEHSDCEEKCCFQKENGNLCGREHKFGYVVQLRDQSFSIIGNHCAQTRFGAESTLRIDISKFKEKREREETLDSIAELLVRKGDIMESVCRALTSSAAARREIKSFEQRIGSDLAGVLHDMGRTQVTAVTVTGVQIREYTNEHREKKEERLHVPVTAGWLRGLAAFTMLRLYSSEGRRSAIERAFAEAKQADSRTSVTELKGVLARLREWSDVIKEAGKIRDLTDSFFNSEIYCIAYLTTDSRYRYEPVRIYLERKGEAHSKEKAKLWLRDASEALKRANKVQRLKC